MKWPMLQIKRWVLRYACRNQLLPETCFQLNCGSAGFDTLGSTRNLGSEGGPSSVEVEARSIAPEIIANTKPVTAAIASNWQRTKLSHDRVAPGE